MPTLSEVYIAERPDARDAIEDLEARLADACALARSAYADVGVEDEALCRALAGLEPPVDELSPDAIRELALGLACARGEQAALRHLEADYFEGVRGALAAMKLPADVRDEVLQEVRRKLLVGDPPKIAGYAGRGSLRGLLKVTATRTAISMLRKTDREAPGDDAILDEAGEPDPELAYLKERYRGVFRAAFEEAVAGLEPRERNLLRLHFLRKVTLDALATMYGVHRATIVRQLAKIRETIERATQRGLRERLGADPREVDSVMDLIRSRFDASVERLLQTQQE
ncbi:MAG: sigma-70 family RNA polymerase sigma factor [Sandaracinaceae bacterium]|nr:sigma-70 family RNA polymerase sigma factor [Sandaracinaceae bacterium]